VSGKQRPQLSFQTKNYEKNKQQKLPRRGTAAALHGSNIAGGLPKKTPLRGHTIPKAPTQWKYVIRLKHKLRRTRPSQPRGTTHSDKGKSYLPWKNCDGFERSEGSKNTLVRRKLSKKLIVCRREVGGRKGSRLAEHRWKALQQEEFLGQFQWPNRSHMLRILWDEIDRTYRNRILLRPGRNVSFIAPEVLP